MCKSMKNARSKFSHSMCEWINVRIGMQGVYSAIEFSNEWLRRVKINGSGNECMWEWVNVGIDEYGNELTWKRINE